MVNTVNDSFYLKIFGGHSLGINDLNASHIYLIHTLLTCSHLLRSQDWVPDCVYSYQCVRYPRLLKPYASSAFSFRTEIHPKFCKIFTFHSQFFMLIYRQERHAVAQLMKHCATSRKVAGSIPDGVIGIFHWHNPSSRTMTLRSTQPLTEISTRIIFWG